MDEIQDILDPTPAQQGMLYQALSAPAPGLYVEQVQIALDASHEADALRQAAQAVVADVQALRSSFHLQNLDRPMQVVRRHVDLPWSALDLTDRPESERTRALDEWLAADRVRPFDLSTAPLARAAFVTMGAGDRRLIWTFHHLVLDGWSLSRVLHRLLFRDDGARLAAATADSKDAVPSLRTFQMWSQRQDQSRAESWWRGLLTDTPRAPSLAFLHAPQGSDRAYGEVEHHLSPSRTDRLRAFARAQQVSLATLFQAAWALLLAREGRTSDVVFGVTVAGRPDELPRADEMIGMFINTVPLRVRLSRELTVAGCLAAIQEQNAARRGADQVSPLLIQQWSGLPPGQPLFETLLVFENYPVDLLRDRRAVVRGITFSGGRTHYPLVLLVMPGESTHVRAVYARSRCEGGAVARLLAELEPLLDEMMSDPASPLGARVPIASSNGAHSFTPAPIAGLDAAAAASVDPPRTPTERELARIWTDVLSVPSVGRGDDFFDLGGHSLLAMQLLARIREAFAMELTIIDLFTMTLTIEELAKLVDSAPAARTP